MRSGGDIPSKEIIYDINNNNKETSYNNNNNNNLDGERGEGKREHDVAIKIKKQWVTA